MNEKEEITIADRKRYYEQVMNPGLVDEIINRKKVFPKAGQYLLEAALKGGSIPKHDLELNDLNVKWLNFCIQSTKEFKERDFMPASENEYIKEWEEEIRKWKRQETAYCMSVLVRKDESRPFFDFSPIEQY